MKNKFIIVPVMLLGVMSIQGCSTMGVGKDEFSCEADEDSTKCGVSPRELYKVSEKPGDFKDNLKKRGMIVDEDGDVLESESKNGNLDTNEMNYLKEEIQRLKELVRLKQERPVTVEEATPQFVLKKPEVIRIWVAPWVDEKNVLHVGGYRYAEVSKKRWEIGNEIMNQYEDGLDGANIKPLQIERSDGTSSGDSEKSKIETLVDQTKSTIRDALKSE